MYQSLLNLHLDRLVLRRQDLPLALAVVVGVGVAVDVNVGNPAAREPALVVIQTPRSNDEDNSCDDWEMVILIQIKSMISN